MKSYGFNKVAEISTEEEKHLESFRNLGFSVIPDVLNDTELVTLRSELDRVYDLQEKDFGAERLALINETDLARFPMVHSESFARLASKRELNTYVEKILGNYYVLHLQNGVINRPGKEHHQSSWHRDLPYQNWVSSEPLACNLYYCLDDFTAETGATFMLPFSHKIDHAPSGDYFSKNAVQVIARAGSVMLFDSMVFHKAGYNSSTSNIRRGVNHMFVKPFISQQMNLPKMLMGRYSDDDYLRMLYGYNTMPADSVKEYRGRRIRN